MVPLLLALSLIPAWLKAADNMENFPMNDDMDIETSISQGQSLMNILLFPLAYGVSQPEAGFEQYPYQTPKGYGSGDRSVAGALNIAQMKVSGGQASRAELRVRGSSRLGWSVSWNGFERGVFDAAEPAAFWSGHVASSYRQTGKILFELGLGYASWDTDRRRGGPSLELNFESYPRRPVSVFVRYQIAAVRREAYHEIFAGLGLNWRWFGFRAGRRIHLTPDGERGGWETGVYGWF